MAEWFDWPLWIHAAKARPNWSFVLIGPAYDGDIAAVHARAAAAPNIHYLGPKRYDELPGYMQFVDVATIPFVLNAITHACSPVKLFEYMAAGKAGGHHGDARGAEIRKRARRAVAGGLCAPPGRGGSQAARSGLSRVAAGRGRANTWHSRAMAAQKCVGRGPSLDTAVSRAVAAWWSTPDARSERFHRSSDVQRLAVPGRVRSRAAWIRRLRTSS